MEQTYDFLIVDTVLPFRFFNKLISTFDSSGYSKLVYPYSIYNSSYFILDSKQIEYEQKFIKRMRPKLKHYLCFKFAIPQKLRICLCIINLLNTIDENNIVSVANISEIKKSKTEDGKRIVRIIISDNKKH